MKKIIFLGIFAYFILSFNVSFAQITSKDLVGKWILTGYDMVPKKSGGKLTAKEQETITTMRKVLSLKPNFMSFTLYEDGATLLEPNPDNLVSTWQFEGTTLSVKTGKNLEQYAVRSLPNGKTEWKALKSKVALPVMTLRKDEVETDVHTFNFVKEPRNPDFRFAGKPFVVEGKLVAENVYDAGKSLYYAIQRPKYDDILLTSLSLNKAGEAESVMFLYINKEQSKELEFSTLSTNEILDVTINFNPFLAETIEQGSAEKKENKFDGVLIRKFKTKKELEDFKKFLKRN